MKKSSLKKPSDIKDVFGAFLVENAQFSKGKYDMPVVKSNVDELPTSLFSYQKVGNKKLELPPRTALHFYNFDYIFDSEHGIWNSLVRGIEFERGFNLKKLEGFDCIIAPDFSLYRDMPIAWQIWNVYRSRVVVHALQELGYRVIVNVRWTDEASYEFCFAGIEEGTIVSVGSHGCSKELADRMLFESGFEEMVCRIKPKTIIIYGKITDSVQRILNKYHQEYISFDSDTSIALEEYRNGHEGE